MNEELPETIAAGEVREVQVCPLGSFENVNEQGKRRTQLCDAEALARVAAAFDAPVRIPLMRKSAVAARLVRMIGRIATARSAPLVLASKSPRRST